MYFPVVFVPLTIPPTVCLQYTIEDEPFLNISWNVSYNIAINIFDICFLFQCGISGNPNTPPLDNYTICINNQCSVYVTDSCLVSIPANFTTTYNVTVSLNNAVGSSGPSPTTNISKSKLM